MEILIVNGYVRENKGDGALIAVLSRQLQGIFPHATVSVASMEDTDLHPDFYRFKNISSIQRYASGINVSVLTRIFRKCIVSIITAIWPLLARRKRFIWLLPNGMRKEMLAIENADIVVSASGGYLNGSNSFFANLHIYYDLIPLRLAERLGKMVVMAPESFGPFGNSWQRHAVRKALNAAQLIFVREYKSYDLLKEIGVKEDRMVRTVDSGFAYEGPSFPSHDRGRTEISVGITARKWLKGKEQKKYESAIADFIVEIEKKYKAKSILIPQVTSSYNADDDRIVETRIKDLAVERGAAPHQIIDDIDHTDIKKIYSQCSFTVGTRFHSVIFSLTSYVPAIAIEYEHKTSGIMHDLDLDEWVIRMEDVTAEKLNALFARLLAEQDSYRKHLLNILPGYIERANEVPRLIKETYERYTGE